MDDKTRRKIAEAAAEDNDWKVDEIRVDEVEHLRRPSCAFYTAANTALPLSYVRNYALFGGQLTRTGDGDVVAKIIDNCSTGASADWWAEIVTRFHRNLGSGLVLQDKGTRPDIVRRLNDASEAFAVPVLDRKKQSVSFLLLNRETYVVYHVEATRKNNGTIEIAKTKVLAGP